MEPVMNQLNSVLLKSDYSVIIIIDSVYRYFLVAVGHAS